MRDSTKGAMKELAWGWTTGYELFERTADAARAIRDEWRRDDTASDGEPPDAGDVGWAERWHAEHAGEGYATEFGEDDETTDSDGEPPDAHEGADDAADC